MEEVKLKHREYCWKFGMSVFQEDEDKSNKVGTLGTGENNGNVVISNTCGVHGYKSKAMSLMRFCHMHILSDSKQKLYKASSFAIKRFPDTFYPCAKIALAPSKKNMCVCVRVWFWKALLCEVQWSRSKSGHLGCTIPNLATTSLLSSYSCRLMHVTYKNLKDFTVIQLNQRPSILLWLDETNVVTRHRCILEC
ncbi:hypothetical protein MTR67_000964 [Solanum verrucosum]|uniref:KAT8 regulatory NSL complex subunit 2 n=1 Tax=Solanum verrucosum TaxID=315347 RepID=A0AAF0PTC4_SOLVR|nr:hypothetical protein MTR67_000964 [Solanum verrucosum]